jgi:hypothetical protein
MTEDRRQKVPPPPPAFAGMSTTLVPSAFRPLSSVVRLLSSERPTPCPATRPALPRRAASG